MQLLTVDQVASRLNTSPRFVRRLIAERRIAFHHVGRFVRIDLQDLEAYINHGRTECGSRSDRNR